MRRALAGLCAVLALLTGCGGKGRLSRPGYSEETRLHYQELAGYKAAVIDRSFITAPEVLAWLEGIQPAEGVPGYYGYIYADADSWDLFVYWPAAGMVGMIPPAPETMRFGLAEDMVQLYFDEGEAAGAQDMLVLVQAPARGSRPTGAALFVQGQRVPLLGGEAAV